MGKQIRADYGQMYLLPPSVEDWVPADHPARFLRELVDTLDLEGLGVRWKEGEGGRPPYAADLLLKVWLYGHMNKIRTTRPLERACREHMSLIWLTGNNPPDHNTLWRFFDENKKALKEVYKKLVGVAARAGLVELVLHAVDGTKIKAKVGKKGALHKKDLNKILKDLDRELDNWEKEVEQAEKEEAGEYRLPQEAANRKALKKKIEEALAELDEAGTEHLHLGDKEARMMRSGDGKIEFSYNAQAVADEKSGLIVAQEVVSDEHDTAQLVPMVEEVEQTLGETAEDTLADGGYATGEQITRARQKEYSVLVNMGKAENKGKYHASKFEYDKERDVVVCPEGRELTFEREKDVKSGKYRVRVYRCRNRKECPVAGQCSRDKRGRQIEIGPYYEAVARQLAKQREEPAQQKLKKRGAIIESVFGIIKEQMGFRRFTYKGLESVRAQWSLVCAAYNLKKMHRLWLEGNLKLEPVAA